MNAINAAALAAADTNIAKTAEKTPAQIAEDYTAANLARSIQRAAERLQSAAQKLTNAALLVETKQLTSYISEVATLQNELANAMSSCNDGHLIRLAADADEARRDVRAGKY